MKLGYIVSHNSYSEFQLSKMVVKAGLRTYTYNMIIEQHSVFAMKSTTPLRQTCSLVHAPLPCSCNLAHSSLRLTQCPCNSVSYLLTQLSITSRNLLAAVFDTTVRVMALYTDKLILILLNFLTLGKCGHRSESFSKLYHQKKFLSL